MCTCMQLDLATLGALTKHLLCAKCWGYTSRQKECLRLLGGTVNRVPGLKLGSLI